MSEWIFTFGGNNANEGRCQVVVAETYYGARRVMIAKWGTHWGFQYSREEWEEFRHDPRRAWPMEVELPDKLYAREDKEVLIKKESK